MTAICYDARHRRLHERRFVLWRQVEQAGCDACLVYGTDGHSEAFRYLTDYTPPLGDMWLVMAGPDRARCVLTFHWSLDEARSRSGIRDWIGYFDPIPHVLQHLEDIRPERMALVGAERMPFALLSQIVAELGEERMVNLDGDFFRLRRVKDAGELARLSAAASITDSALEDARDAIRPGMTETELLGIIARRVFGSGAVFAFPPLVVSGRDHPVIARGATDRVLRSGDAVMLDIGAQVDGYRSDVSRTYFVGAPSEDQVRAWKAVEKAHQEILSLARPGIRCVELNVAGRKSLLMDGYDVLHRMGHGVGLATSFEWPDLETDTDPLEPGMSLAIEPGVYVEGVGSLKLEDMIVITETGYELLSQADRSPILPKLELKGPGRIPPHRKEVSE